MAVVLNKVLERDREQFKGGVHLAGLVRADLASKVVVLMAAEKVSWWLGR
ncbi:MAG TPA: hypothetical protein VGD78_14760 [Chthoniobacterales bacterium]